MTDIEVYDLSIKMPDDEPLKVSFGMNRETLFDDIGEQLDNLDVGEELIITKRMVRILDIF